MEISERDIAELDERIWWTNKSLQAVRRCIQEYRTDGEISCGSALDVRNFSQHLAGTYEGDQLAEFCWQIGEYPPYLHDLADARIYLQDYLAALRQQQTTLQNATKDRP